MSIGGRPRVAVIGASGIGKHHANWWTLEGAHVCAIVGTRRESLEKAVDGLRKLFPFQGEAFTETGTMLREMQPDIVDVCSPPPWHAVHVRDALDHGCHVLCEKPFVYDPDLTTDECRKSAEALVELAAKNNRALALCIQYFEAGAILKSLWEAANCCEPLRRVKAHLAAPAKGRPPQPERVWTDLAPHPISLLQSVFPESSLMLDTLEVRFDGYEAEARFSILTGNGPVSCEILTSNTTGEPANVRRFDFNGRAFKVEADVDEERVYCARFESEGVSRREPDMMRLLIRHFLAGKTPTGGDVAVRNLDWLLTVLDRARLWPTQGRMAPL